MDYSGIVTQWVWWCWSPMAKTADLSCQAELRLWLPFRSPVSLPPCQCGLTERKAFWIICNIAVGADMYKPLLFLKFLALKYEKYEPFCLSLICNSYQIMKGYSLYFQIKSQLCYRKVVSPIYFCWKDLRIVNNLIIHSISTQARDQNSAYFGSVLFFPFTKRIDFPNHI